MGLQAVMVYPRMKASALYFKLKLSVYYFTLYNLKTHAGHCFLWDQTEADLNANVFTFIVSLDLQREETTVLYSDGCNYQNRNGTLSYSLLNLS